MNPYIPHPQDDDYPEFHQLPTGIQDQIIESMVDHVLDGKPFYWGQGTRTTVIDLDAVNMAYKEWNDGQLCALISRARDGDLTPEIMRQLDEEVAKDLIENALTDHGVTPEFHAWEEFYVQEEY